MAKSLLGVEIGKLRCGFVEISNGKIIKYAEKETPENLIVGDGNIVSENGMIDFIKTTKKAEKIGTKNIAITMPDEGTFIRRLYLPPMTASQLKINLPYEFRDYITDEKDKYIYDYKMIGLEKDEDDKCVGMHLIAVAADKEMVDKYQTMFKMSGCKLKVAIPYNVSIENLIKGLNIQEGEYAVAHLGDVYTKVIIYEDGFYDMNRVIESGILDLAKLAGEILSISPYSALMCLKEGREDIVSDSQIKDVCDSIALSIARVINYYTYQKGENNLKTMYMTGEGVLIKPLVESLKDIIPIDLVFLSEFANGEKEKEVLIMSPTAVGACLNYGEAFHE